MAPLKPPHPPIGSIEARQAARANRAMPAPEQRGRGAEIKRTGMPRNRRAPALRAAVHPTRRASHSAQPRRAPPRGAYRRL
jgi:hypothetical protein